MKKFFSIFSVAMMMAVVSVGLVSCKDDDPDKVSVSMSMASIDQKGGSQQIAVVSNTKWTISGAPSWLQVSPMSSSGNGSFSISASENTDKSARTCTLMVQAGSASAMVSVSQPGKQIDDDPVGSYTGTLKPMGFSDAPARCYVTITKLSSDAVRLSSLICEEFGLDMNAVNLKLTKRSDGSIYLESETTKSIEGTYFQGQLTLTFSNSIATFYFSGVKNN